METTARDGQEVVRDAGADALRFHLAGHGGVAGAPVRDGVEKALIKADGFVGVGPPHNQGDGALMLDVPHREVRDVSRLTSQRRYSDGFILRHAAPRFSAASSAGFQRTGNCSRRTVRASLFFKVSPYIGQSVSSYVANNTQSRNRRVVRRRVRR